MLQDQIPLSILNPDNLSIVSLHISGSTCFVHDIIPSKDRLTALITYLSFLFIFLGVPILFIILLQRTSSLQKLFRVFSYDTLIFRNNITATLLICVIICLLMTSHFSTKNPSQLHLQMLPKQTISFKFIFMTPLLSLAFLVLFLHKVLLAILILFSINHHHQPVPTLF